MDTVSAEKSFQAGERALSDDDSGGVSPSKKSGTAQDKKDMWRIGREQELNRTFNFLSILGFTAVLMCTWEAVLFGSSFGLIDGGAGGMIYSYIGGMVGFGSVILAMTEMASM